MSATDPTIPGTDIAVTPARVAPILGTAIAAAIPYFLKFPENIQVILIIGVLVLTALFMILYAWYVTKRKVAEVQRGQSSDFAKGGLAATGAVGGPAPSTPPANGSPMPLAGDPAKTPAPKKAARKSSR